MIECPLHQNLLLWHGLLHHILLYLIATRNVYFRQGGLPLQLDVSEVSSYVSNIGIESLLAFGPSSSDRQVEASQIIGDPDVAQSNNRNAPSSIAELARNLLLCRDVCFIVLHDF